MSIIHSQPFKGVYSLVALLFEITRFPLWLAYFTFSRPHPKWTLRQTLGVFIVKRFLQHSSAIRVKTPLSLAPGKEKDRFVVIHPPAASNFQGLTDDKEIRPERIGATWSPKPLQRSQVDDADVVLHFHGGAYVIGNGRDEDIGFAAKVILKHGRVSHVFTPQYRLASNPGGRFPAALQDAITSYLYLVETLRVPPTRIILSGDSAGGNLVLALTRYIAEYGTNLSIPSPGALWLWSPWINVEEALDPTAIARSPQYTTDYLGAEFATWGSHAFAEKNDPANPYLSALHNPFEIKAPIFIQTGRAEVLYDDNVALAKELEDKGNNVKLVIKEAAPHDIILIGHLLGFTREIVEAVKEAGEFYRENRRSAHL